ncbi:mannose-6-phosphate isomerase [Puniceicoccales bacterium CK1056]|uniref:Mannose-6-phosphate isomerase n=1 Tax=Oceanipulchritudo coccoides TaxID=2706888 RepID=A0A6B2M2F1_9BACT|nr:type I phosphomannose isomerase catalytic subunit [Oceanipulchritudo coccoides]NDV62257.1 mannose-6-phosphate isomerase [Oceanipulchritudo coccoides]
MISFLRFTPIYQERVWGGRGLELSLGRDLPEGKVIGESWELVDRPEADSPLDSGTGTLGTLRRSDPNALMGPGWPADRPFPILVKWLDCQDRLSLQVHPPASVAPELNGEPKTENWYIVEATPDAALLAGVKPGVQADVFRKAIEDEELEGLVCRLPARKGDSLFVRSGRLHAIDAGNLILEIQQNSDTTYRVYDWGRVGLDGKPRQLHIEESMKSIDFEDTDPELMHPEGPESVLADSEEFRLRRLELKPGEELFFPANEEPRILSVAEGKLVAGDGNAVTRGDNIILPYSGESSWKAETASVVLVTDRFNTVTSAQ